MQSDSLIGYMLLATSGKSGPGTRETHECQASSTVFH